MGFLSKSDKEIWAQEEVKKYDDKLRPVLGPNGLSNLRKTLAIIAEEQGFEEAKAYLNYTNGRVNYYVSKQKDYLIESRLADKVYKSYVTDGVSRLEKINGRFMAAQNMKLDLLIEQNNRIIQLLEKIAGEEDSSFSNNEFNNFDVSEKPSGEIEINHNVCPNCDSVVDSDSNFCTNCGSEINK